MCIGVPLQIQSIEADGLFGVAADGALRERIDLRLLGAVPMGTWVLNFNGAARRVLDPTEAQQIRAALAGLEAALAGDEGAVNALFADLIEREPQLPDHLRTDALASSAGPTVATASAADASSIAESPRVQPCQPDPAPPARA